MNVFLIDIAFPLQIDKPNGINGNNDFRRLYLSQNSILRYEIYSILHPVPVIYAVIYPWYLSSSYFPKYYFPWNLFYNNISFALYSLNICRYELDIYEPIMTFNSWLWHRARANLTVDAAGERIRSVRSHERTDISDFSVGIRSSLGCTYSRRGSRETSARRTAHARAIDAQVHFWWKGDAGKRGMTRRFRRDH